MIRGLDDYKKEEQKGKANNYYAGGEKSGLSVQSPEDVESILNNARNQSSQNLPPPSDDEVRVKITLYRNGFTIDDGEFRDYEQEDNKKFMQELNQNRVPTEMLRKTRGKPVSVGLEDRRQEDYRLPTPPRYVAFQGEGQSLSSTTSVAFGEVNLNLEMTDVNQNEPTTNLQIRFHNGQRKNITVNLTTTVGQIIDYVTLSAPIDGSFQLLSGFPPKPLENPSQTVQQAELQGSAVIQKLI